MEVKTKNYRKHKPDGFENHQKSIHKLMVLNLGVKTF